MRGEAGGEYQNSPEVVDSGQSEKEGGGGGGHALAEETEDGHGEGDVGGHRHGQCAEGAAAAQALHDE
eukprot:scaffold10099_cov137-Isochrysis_galbana.AAC.1